MGACVSLGEGAMAMVDPFLLLLFLPKAVPCESHLACAQIVPGTRGRKERGGGGACPFKSVFSVLFPSFFPSSSLH